MEPHGRRIPTTLWHQGSIYRSIPLDLVGFHQGSISILLSPAKLSSRLTRYRVSGRVLLDVGFAVNPKGPYGSLALGRIVGIIDVLQRSGPVKITVPRGILIAKRQAVNLAPRLLIF